MGGGSGVHWRPSASAPSPPPPLRLLLYSSFLLLLLLHKQWGGATAQTNGTLLANNIRFPVGVILDTESLIGSVGWSCITMAVDDFYAAHPNYRIRLSLHLKDTDHTAIGAASSALDLLNDQHVQTIIGPQKSSQAKFLMEIGDKAHVPILSFSATSPSLSTVQSQYFIRTALNDTSQAKAIASLVEAFKWRQVVPIFEDTEDGNGIIPFLIDELQEINVAVPYRSMISPSARRDQIIKELDRLKALQTRVFVVHMSCDAGFNLFTIAKAEGMMEKEYVWIITYGLTDIFDYTGSTVNNVMQGVLGVKPHFNESGRLREFKLRWRKQLLKGNLSSNASEPTGSGIWAYDTIWALAMAVEKSNVAVDSSYHTSQTSNEKSSLTNLVQSPTGKVLLESISLSNFRGLSGKFHLIDKQLQASAIEIVNFNGINRTIIGLWTPGRRKSGDREGKTIHKANITWPGGLTDIPKGWEWPTSAEKKLRIGVPVKPGFREFIDRDPVTNKSTGGFRGFCPEIFDKVMAGLPYNVSYEYVPFENSTGQSNGSYNELVYQVHLQKFDAVVGDVTILANRSRYVDYTLPFTLSGVTMVVPVKEDDTKSAWAFVKPMTSDLWAATGISFILTGFVVWVFEHRINGEFRGQPVQQLGTIFYFSFSTVSFAHREKLLNNLSRVVVVTWAFVVLILTSSYTASLTSTLTVQRLQPTITDMNELKRKGFNVGYLKDSFIREFLKGLNFDVSKLTAYESPQEYAEAMSKGSSNGGVAAVIDEIPNLKVFLSKYCGKYMMVGPTYRTDGFGFVFPKGSPLVRDVSRSILRSIEGGNLTEIEDKYMKQKCPPQSTEGASSSLTLDSFWGLFLITGLTSACALILFFTSFCYQHRNDLNYLGSETSLCKKITMFFSLYNLRDPSCDDRDKEEASKDEPPLQITAPDINTCDQSPSSLSNLSYGNSDYDDGEETPLEGEGTPCGAIATRGSLSFAQMLNESEGTG